MTAFGNALIADIEKLGNHFLVEKVVMDQTAARDIICQNMVHIWKLIGTVTFEELNKVYINIEWKNFFIVSMI